MKTIIACLIIISCSTFAFAVDAEINNVTITKNRQGRLSEINGIFGKDISGITYWEKEKKLVVTSTRAITDDEKQQILNGISGLSDAQKETQKTVEDRLVALESDVATIKAR